MFKRAPARETRKIAWLAWLHRFGADKGSLHTLRGLCVSQCQVSFPRFEGKPAALGDWGEADRQSPETRGGWLGCLAPLDPSKKKRAGRSPHPGPFPCERDGARSWHRSRRGEAISGSAAAPNKPRAAFAGLLPGSPGALLLLVSTAAILLRRKEQLSSAAGEAAGWVWALKCSAPASREAGAAKPEVRLGRTESRSLLQQSRCGEIRAGGSEGLLQPKQERTASH
uniref:Uncharacterized protein n=1 Tax=Sphaerodactylus townsendi TaxID=933632 RepID=A0ACB8EUD8_9SAUR